MEKNRVRYRVRYHDYVNDDDDDDDDDDIYNGGVYLCVLQKSDHQLDCW